MTYALHREAVYTIWKHHWVLYPSYRIAREANKTGRHFVSSHYCDGDIVPEIAYWLKTIANHRKVNIQLLPEGSNFLVLDSRNNFIHVLGESQDGWIILPQFKGDPFSNKHDGWFEKNGKWNFGWFVELK